MVFFIEIYQNCHDLVCCRGIFSSLSWNLDVISTLNPHFQDWVIFVACNMGKSFVWVRTQYQLWIKLRLKQTFLVKQTSLV